MDSKILKAYEHYKSLYGSTLLLFLVRDSYEAYFDDAATISSILEISQYTELTENNGLSKIRISDCNVLDIVKILHDHGHECKLIQQRNAQGVCDIPDVETIQKEQELDF